MLQLRAGQMAKHLGAHRVGVALGQSKISVIALHLGLPIAFKGCQNLFQLGAAQRCCRQELLLASLSLAPCFSMRIRHFRDDSAASRFDHPATVDASAKGVVGRKGRPPLRSIVFFVTSPLGGFQYSVVWLKKAGIPGQGDPTGDGPRGGNQRQPLRRDSAARMQEQA